MHACYPITVPVRSASPAAFDILRLDEAHHQLSIPDGLTAHDPAILDWIAEARDAVERDAMLVTATGTYTVKMTSFGSGDHFEFPSSLRPVTAVSSITYVNTSGSTSTWSSSEYTLDTYTISPIVRLVYGYSWPTLRGDINGITITATAGYASAAAIPKRVKDAAKLYLSHSWHVFLGQTKEADGALKAYENLIHSLRPEVYA